MSEGRLLITAGGSLVTALRGLGGGITVITAGDPAYDAARAVWNGAIDRRPYCIVTCHSATDVAGVVHACTVHQVSVTVRGGGHSVSGLAVKDGAVLIDLCDDSVTLTADRQTVVVGGGATWAMVDAVTAPAEVYVPAGLVSHTGVGGLTLGGGIGWLARTRGLTIDSLIEVEMVTASAEILVASPREHRDLFWGLRGGGAGLGIVTQFTFRTHSVPAVKLLECHFPSDQTSPILQAYATLCAEAPDNVSVYGFATSETFLVVAAVLPPIDDSVNEFLGRIHGWKPLDVTEQTCSLAELNQRYDHGNRAGQGYRWSRSAFLEAAQLNSAAADAIARFILGSPSGVTVQISPLGGAIARVSSAATAFTNRFAAHEVHALVGWDSPLAPAAAVRAVQRFSSVLDECGGTAGYVNIVPGDSPEWLSRAYGEAAADRLNKLKDRFDPLNFFSSSPLGRVRGVDRWRILPPDTPNAATAIAPHAIENVRLQPPVPPPLVESMAGSMFDAIAVAVSKPFKSFRSLIVGRLEKGLNSRMPLEISAPYALQQSNCVYFCDGCMQVIAEDPPPFGTLTTRYHCSECERFDLCETCYAANTHPHHLWRESAALSRVGTGTSTASLLLATLDNFRDRWCFGTRHIDGEWQWTTFGDVKTRVEHLTCGLRDGSHIEPRTRAGICGPNCEDWLVIDFALIVNNCMSVPLDFTTTNADLRFTIEKAELSVVFCSATYAERLAEIARDCSRLTTLIIGNFGESPEQSVAPVNPPPHLTVVVLGDVEEQGRSTASIFDRFVVEALPTDIVTVIFSSGSTGQPKGIQLSDTNLRRRIAAVIFPPDPCVIVAYMPLCHSFERMNILTHCVAGGRAAFHPGSVATILRTCVEVRPTSFSSTPRLWNVLYQDFNAALQLSTASREDVLADYTGRLGGRTQHIGTGGALTRKEVVDFLRECFQCSVIDGFGTTETGGLLWDGAPGSYVRAKLLDCVDFQYFSTDKPYPRGELCVSSSTMASEGYLGDPAATEAAFYVDEAGTAWYRTGDICEHRPRDKYHVVDRIKSVFKLSHGKFVAPQALEQLYETLSIVQQCWVTAAPWAEFTVAVVVVGRVAALAAGLDLGVDDVACSEHFNHGGALERFVQSAMKDIAVTEGIPPFQHPRGIILQTTPWTADTGELTGTHKLRRPVLERQYASAVRALYTKLGDSGSDHPEPLSMDRHGVSPSRQSASRHRAKSIIASVASIALSDSKALGGPLATILPDSLAALRAIGLLNREFNKNFPVTVLLEAGATIDSVTALLLSSGVDSVELDPSTLESDARAADNIAPVPWSVAKAPCGVQVALLTGSTGFVGTFLLAEMLRQLPAQSKVFCIVRAPTAAAGVSRLQKQLALSGLLDACDVLRWRSRVVVLNGNLAAPALGLHAESWDSLASSVDLIVHCGAHVNSLLPYSVLRGANVDGTKELLRLACSRPSEACFMCHISTVGVLPPSALLPLKEGADVPVGHLSRANGYSQSKWVAETMVRRSFARGVSGCVIRPATVFCDSSSGYFNHTDFVVRSLRGMVELGAAPALGPQHVMADITPVNELARVTVTLCTTAERRLHVHGRTLNVSSGQMQMAWLVEHLAACHSEIKMMPWRVWQTTLEASVDGEPVGTANALHPLHTFFRGHTFPGAIATDTAEAKATLLACGIDPPMPVTAATADTFIRRLAEPLGRQI